MSHYTGLAAGLSDQPGKTDFGVVPHRYPQRFILEKLQLGSDKLAIDIEQLKVLNKAEQIAITEHGRQRLVERAITVSDIVHCIATGEIIKQYEDDKPFPSCLILGKTLNDEYIHTVVSHDDTWIYLITAYRPDSNIWESGFKVKKGC